MISVTQMTRRELEQELIKSRIVIRDFVEQFDGLTLLKDMTEPELAGHLNRQLRFIKASQTPDTVGSMLIIFGDNGISQYGATVDPETAPAALRELADRIEKRQTVKR